MLCLNFRAKIQVNNSEFQYHFIFNAIVVLWLFSNFSSSSFQFTQWEIVSLLYDPVINLMTQWDTFKIFCRANQEVNDELIHMSQPFSTDFKADVNRRKNALDFIIKIHDIFFAKIIKWSLMSICMYLFRMSPNLCNFESYLHFPKLNVIGGDTSKSTKEHRWIQFSK